MAEGMVTNSGLILFWENQAKALLEEIEKLSQMKYCYNCHFYFESPFDICPECEEDIRVVSVKESEAKKYD